jgi:hypothetical protein
MHEPRKIRPSARRKSAAETIRQGASDPRDAHRVKCGGGYRVIRKAIPGS